MVLAWPMASGVRVYGARHGFGCPVAVPGYDILLDPWTSGHEDACMAHTSFGYFAPFPFDVLTAIGVLASRYAVDAPLYSLGWSIKCICDTKAPLVRKRLTIHASRDQHSNSMRYRHPPSALQRLHPLYLPSTLSLFILFPTLAP